MLSVMFAAELMWVSALVQICADKQFQILVRCIDRLKLQD
jgi:hypothetical protein